MRTAEENETTSADEDFLRAVLDHIPVGVSIFDAGARLAFCNRAAKALLDLPPALFQAGAPGLDALLRFDVERGEQGEDERQEALARARQPRPQHFERVRPDGRVLDVRETPLPGGGFVAVHADVTRHKAGEQALRQKNEVFQTLIDNIPCGVTLFDAAFRLVAYNQEFKRLLDFPDELFHEDTDLERLFRYNAARGEYGGGDVEQIVRSLLERARKREAHLFERARPNGMILEVRGVPLPDGGFVTLYTDVTEHRRAAEAIARLAHQDALTGLANRHTLEARLEQCLADARRHGTRLALLFIDMDRFKSINDTLGHAVGDEFLIEIARRLSGAVRECDIVARLGGDEFVIVVTEVACNGDAATVADKVIKAASRPMEIGPHRLASSASVGIAVYPADGEDRDALMRGADAAMYAAKAAGAGVWRFFASDMTAGKGAAL